MVAIESLRSWRTHPNVRAVLWALRYGEGTQRADGYQILFGGDRFLGADNKADTFDDFADHPRKKITRTFRNGKTVTSTAAGAYQIIKPTWDDVQSRLHLPDFSPESQDLAAIFLIARRGAINDVLVGALAGVVEKLNQEWASLPGSPYGQPIVSFGEFKAQYDKAGGLYVDPWKEPAPKPPPAPPIPVPGPAVDRQPPAPVEDRSTYPETKEPHMLPALFPILSAVLPSLIQLVPQLGKIFGSGSEIQERNVAAATAVIDVAAKAIGATNAQDVAEKIAADPAAAQTAKKAIEENFLKIVEVGGGIEAARATNLAFATATVEEGARLVPLWHQPAFVITCVLMVPLFFVVFAVLQPFWDNSFSDDIKLVVVTAIISGVLSSITGFWLGSSFGSQKKDSDKNDTITQLINRG